MKKRKIESKIIICIVMTVVLVSLIIIMVAAFRFFFIPYDAKENQENYAKWLCIGDSITLGETNRNVSYADYVAKMIPINLVKEGHSGYTTSRFTELVDEFETDVDFVTVFVGTNDWVYDRPLGDVKDETDDTFCGSMNRLMNKVKAQYPDAHVYFLTPIFRDMQYNPSIPFMGIINSNGDSIKDFSEAMKQCADNKQVEVIDLYAMSGIDEKNISYYTNDGTHPNFKGHSRIAFVLRKILQNEK